MRYAIIAMASALAACAQQPVPVGGYPVQFRCPPSGSSVQSTGGSTITFLGAVVADPEVCRARLPNGREIAAIYSFAPTTAPYADQFRAAMRRLFPLSPGKSSEFTVLGQDSGETWQVRMRVVGYQRVRIPAGEFDTWVMEWTERGFVNNVHHSVRTYWIEDQTWMPVMFRFDLRAGDGGLNNWEAARVTRR